MTGSHALSRRRARRILAAVASGVALAGAVPTAGGAAPSPAAGRCAVASGPQTTPLVELYTSEGCSSCPPANRWLSTTVPSATTGALALAFHVDYWDRLGWHDRFAAAAFTERQYDAKRANRARFVYTPQVLLQGRDWTGYRADAASSLAAVRARPARAAITLAAASREGTIAIDATTTVGTPADRADARLFVALVDSGHVSDVKAGENTGIRLVHDHVVGRSPHRRRRGRRPAWRCRGPPSAAARPRWWRSSSAAAAARCCRRCGCRSMRRIAARPAEPRTGRSGRRRTCSDDRRCAGARDGPARRQRTTCASSPSLYARAIDASGIGLIFAPCRRSRTAGSARLQIAFAAARAGFR